MVKMNLAVFDDKLCGCLPSTITTYVPAKFGINYWLRVNIKFGLVEIEYIGSPESIWVIPSD